MKNYNEFRVFLRRAVNESKSLIGAGKTGIGEILGKVLTLIKPGQDAFEDAGLALPELGAATNGEMDDSDLAIRGLLGNFSPEQQRDADAIEKGITAVLRWTARARAEGRTEGIEIENARFKGTLKKQGISDSVLAKM